jgi:hypothetical protein
LIKGAAKRASAERGFVFDFAVDGERQDQEQIPRPSLRAGPAPFLKGAKAKADEVVN